MCGNLILILKLDDTERWPENWDYNNIVSTPISIPCVTGMCELVFFLINSFHVLCGIHSVQFQSFERVDRFESILLKLFRSSCNSDI